MPKLLDRIGASSSIHAYGNKSWPSLAKSKYRRKGFKVHQVVHKDNKYTKNVRSRSIGAAKTKLATITGTQTIDRAWTELDRAIPRQLCKKPAHEAVKQEVYDRVWAWLYRYNKRHRETTAAAALSSFAKILVKSQ